jgi:hypothetical protein
VGFDAIEIQQISVMVELCRFAQLSCPSSPDFIQKLAAGVWGLQTLPDYTNNVATFPVLDYSEAEKRRFHPHLVNSMSALCFCTQFPLLLGG